jgi:diaminopimelate decarboxylase
VSGSFCTATSRRPRIDALAGLVRFRQDVLIRVAPDVDPGTHPAITTGTSDQKFGFGIASGEVEDAVRAVLDHPSLRLVGLHCHLGSQITSSYPYEVAADRMVELMASINRRYGLRLERLNLGGGHGIRYTAGDDALSLIDFSNRVPSAIRFACQRLRVPYPRLTVEPGRALVGPSTVAVYRVAAVKRRSGGRTFVAVDGGMSDNPRPALYGARYTVRLLGRPLKALPRPMTVVGRHCESGDVLATDVPVPEDVHAGDLLVIPVAGAYQQSMAAQYNLVGRPPVVAVSDGEARLIVRRCCDRQVGAGQSRPHPHPLPHEEMCHAATRELPGHFPGPTVRCPNENGLSAAPRPPRLRLLRAARGIRCVMAGERTDRRSRIDRAGRRWKCQTEMNTTS